MKNKKIRLVVPGKNTVVTGTVLETEDITMVYLDEEPKFCEDYVLGGVKYGVGNTYNGSGKASPICPDCQDSNTELVMSNDNMDIPHSWYYCKKCRKSFPV